MKKIIFAVLVGIAVLGMIVFNPKEKQRIPETGLYWIMQNSYYGIQKGEEILIGLDLFLIDSDDCEIVQEIKEISLVDSEDREFQILNKDYEIQVRRFDYDCGKKRILNAATLYLACEPMSSNVFSKIRYHLNGTEYEENVGRIEIEYVESSSDIIALSNRLDWVTIAQPAIKRADCIVENQCDEAVEVVSLNYGSTGICPKMNEAIKILPNQEKSFDIELSVTEETNIPIIYYVKPVLQYMINGENKQHVFDNISREAFYGVSMEETKEYLYQLGEKRIKDEK